MSDTPLTPPGAEVTDPETLHGGVAPELQTPAEEPQDGPSQLPSVFDDLQVAYAGVSDERSRCYPLLPGRFKGRLGFRCVPCDNDEREKAEATLFRRGLRGVDFETAVNANLIVMTTDSIVMRAPDTGKWRNLDKFNPAWSGVKVKWDARLAAAIKMDFGVGELDPVVSCQMFFRNPEALGLLASTIGSWLREEVSQEPDEDDEEPVRPT